MKMATAAPIADNVKSDLSCAICLDLFKDPVILKCGHNFCRMCICVHWDQNGEDYGYLCPVCRAEFNKRTFTKNYVVQNLVTKLNDLGRLGSSPASSSKPAKIDDDLSCDDHGEELKLYCHTDKRPICVVCRESRAHRSHQVSPVSEVMNDMKMEFKVRAMELKWQKSQCVKVINTDEHMKSDVRIRKQRLKSKIEADVGALVQFLLDERDSLLESLDAAEVASLAVVDENLNISLKEEAAVDKAIMDIHSCTSGKASFEKMSAIYNEVIHSKPFMTLEPVNCSAEFSEFSRPFQLIMWKKMMHVLHTMPQNLTLDPDTAHLSLLISDFDTKVEESHVRIQEPDLPARFNRFFGVLATAQYASGQHYWEVDVRDKGVWYLGVTTECSNRKGFVSLTPSAGYWSLCLQDRLYANEEDGRVPVADYWNSPRVGVYLDYDNGRLSFYDAVTMRRLYLFETCFDEPVCPFFSPGKNDPSSRLQICHYY